MNASRQIDELEAQVVRLKQDLAESEERRRLLFENLPQRIFFKDRNSVFTAANELFAVESGLTASGLVGKSDYDLYPADLAEKYQADDRRVMASGTATTLVEKNVVAGNTRMVEVTKAPLISSEGEVIGLLGMFNDVTERFEAEKSLQHERYLLHALMDNIPDSIYFKDEKSRFTRINAALAQRLGTAADDAIGKTDHDFFAPKHAGQAAADELRVMTTGRPIISKLEQETWETGKQAWVSTTKVPLRDSHGKIIGTFGISRDITTLIEAEQRLKKSAKQLRKANEEIRLSEQLYRQLTEGTQDAIVVMDQSGIILLFNPAAQKIFGRSSEEVLNQSARLLFGAPHEGSRTVSFDSLLADPARNVPGKTIELQGVRGDGSRFPIDATISVLGSGAEQIILAAMRNATDRHQIQAKLVQVEKISALGILSAGMAHEINNPLAYVANNLTVIEADLSDLLDVVALFVEAEELIREHQPELGARIAAARESTDLSYVQTNMPEVIQTTRKGVERVADIIRGLQKFSRIDRAKIDRFDLKEAIDSSLELIQGRLNRNGIQVIREIQSVPQILCEPAQLNQVVLNLLINAMHAIEATGRSDGRISIRLSHVDDRVALEVSDNGCGIPADVLPRIFDPFFTTKDVGEGSGLGLSIIHGIVSDHDGIVSVDSEENTGSKFRVVLPLTATQESSSRSSG